MEKKVPEKKVAMKEDDIFYVYEKRINKCIKEGCEGIVKYGLIKKVDINGQESINCFECNKCHMKYTPYPNYNRLQDKHLSAIYNQSEVEEWQERTTKKVNSRKAAAKKPPFKFNTRKTKDSKPYEKKKSFVPYKDRTDRDGSSVKSEGAKSYSSYAKPYTKKSEGTYGAKSGSGYKGKSNTGMGQSFTVRKGNIIITSNSANSQMKRNTTQNRRPVQKQSDHTNKI